MFRNFTLSLLFICLCLAGKLSYANTIVVNGPSSTSYSLNPGDTLLINSGTYTGTVSGLNANTKTIIVAAGATFWPSSLPNNTVCKMIIYGTFTYSSSLTTNTDFTLDNYAGGIVNLAAMNTKGKNQVWINHQGGTINFSGDVLINGGTLDDDNNVFINYETINASGNFQMNSGSKFTNYKDFNVAGSYKANGGSLRNEGNFVVTGLLEINSGATPITNYCRLQALGGIDISNSTFINYSYVWAQNSDIKITSGGIKNIPFYNNNPPMIHGRNYIQTGGAVTGPAYMYFYGTTSITSGGTIGVAAVPPTTDTIKMYDITRTNGSQIFDVQGGTINPNVIYNAWGVPDSLKVYLLGCSIEVILESPLAINWNYFDVTLSENIPAISWSADYQQGTVFELQRSYDGRNFSKIKEVAVEVGRSSYGYDDIFVNTQQSVVYYRIKSIELNGAEKYTPIRSVRFNNKKGNTFYTAPNPFKSSFLINYKSAENQMVTVRMFAINGQQKLMKKVSVNKGDNTITIPDADRFASGVYVVQITNSYNQVSASKIVKQ